MQIIVDLQCRLETPTRKSTRDHVLTDTEISGIEAGPMACGSKEGHRCSGHEEKVISFLKKNPGIPLWGTGTS